MLRGLLLNLKKLAFLHTFALGFAVLLLCGTSAAQFEHASPPVADPRDHRFDTVHEDWTSPALTKSSLLPVRPLLGSTDEGAAYTLELLCLQWRWGDPIDVYVIKPKGVKNPPVILYQYGYPAETDIFRDERWDEAVTKEGFAAVGFVSALTGQRYHDRPMREWFVSELQESLADSAHDIQMVINYLGSRGDLDMNRVGMFTQGAGATIGILASAVDPRIKVLDALDPWGDWPTWMATSPFVPEEERRMYVKPDFLPKAATLEPADWLPKVQAKKFRFQQTAFDKVTPVTSKDKLRAAVAPGVTVTVYKTPEEYSAVMVGNQQLDWIRSALRALPELAPEKGSAEKSAVSK
ncbi:MAG: alpha/beta hydrolase [Terriglobales bacterium]